MIRFRPIMMTTMAALLGALPIALGLGAGGEARRPLGLAVVGGLLVSQLITLYLTPVVYTYMARLMPARRRVASMSHGRSASIGPERPRLLLGRQPGGERGVNLPTGRRRQSQLLERNLRARGVGVPVALCRGGERGQRFEVMAHIKLCMRHQGSRGTSQRLADRVRFCREIVFEAARHPQARAVEEDHEAKAAFSHAARDRKRVTSRLATATAEAAALTFWWPPQLS